MKYLTRFGSLLAGCLISMAPAYALPEGFVYVDEVIPDVQVDLRYAGNHNFVGRPVIGYIGHRAVLTRQAAQALAGVQADLRPFGLQLKIFDAYRPQQAVDDFVLWSKDGTERSTKAEFYPHLDKAVLFPQGYIAEKSSHSRGSTVDLSIAQQQLPPAELDMGTPFDYFGPESWPDYAGASAQQRANRLLLRTLMVKHGFSPYQQEWWHFTYVNEPFPDTYFNFIVD